MPSYDRKKIRKFFRSTDRALTVDDKGKALEDLSCYVFGRVPGLRLSQRNEKNRYETEEIDVAFWNEQDANGLKAFDPILLVECKNWSKPVGSEQVAWFLTKIENRSLDFGILLAANGITGSAEDGKQAHDLVSKALMKKIRMIVITRAEIEALTHTDELVILIKTKLCQLVVSGTVWP
jgi:hypothetical protein